LTHPLLPVAILVTLGAGWGVATAIARYVSVAGVPPLGYSFWTSLGAGTVLVAVCLASGRAIPLSARHLRFYLVCGLTGTAVPTSNMFFVLAHIPAGLMAIVITTSPLITYGLALALGMERPDLRRALGIGLGLAGTALIVLPKGSLPHPSLTPFVILSFLTPTMYALNGIYASRHRPPESDSLALAAGMMGAAAIVLLPAMLLTGSFHPLWSQAGLAEALILVHVAINALGFFLLFVLLSLAGPVYVSQIGYLVTLFGIAAGMIAFGERLSSLVWAAVVLVFAGVALVNARRAVPAAAREPLPPAAGGPAGRAAGRSS